MNPIALLCLLVGLFLLTPGTPAAMTDTPAGLLCELLPEPANSRITDSRPEFAWIVPTTVKADFQTAYQIQVASTADSLRHGKPDLWDSGKVLSADSVNVEYSGKPLESQRSYFWRVRTWNRENRAGSYSSAQEFRTGDLSPTAAPLPLREEAAFVTNRAPLVHTPIRPVRMVRKGPEHWFLDFGRAAFGYLQLTAPAGHAGRRIEVRFGEKAIGDRVDMAPGGTIRAVTTSVVLDGSRTRYRVALPPLRRPAQAVPLPPSVGEVLPFRYVEVIGCPFPVDKSTLIQTAIHYPFDDAAADFRSSDPLLNRIWELCKYSIKATTFASVYVDGDRERIPYEADAYINQLSHYAVDREFTLARHSHEYLLTHPTWPTEWKHHSIFMAWEDYQYTGNAESLATHYDLLKSKLMEERLRPDGLLGSAPRDIERNDIIDWPAGERDGYQKTALNTVVNAFHYRSLVLMARIAGVLGKAEDEIRYRDMAERVRALYDRTFLDPVRGIYKDGAETDHASLHANLFPLVFGLVGEENRASVLAFIRQRGMACSVYVAQYLLEALFQAGDPETALRLISDGNTDRSWAAMLRSGTTITWEAWDLKYKPNQDWNHAWGAAPANILPRYILGVTPLTPGFSRVRIRPNPGPLASASGKVPTIRGPVTVDVRRSEKELTLRVTLPANMTGRIELPLRGRTYTRATLNGKPVPMAASHDTLVIESILSGTQELRLH